MPGIVGLITKQPRSQALDDLRRMVNTLRHEPFYTSGTWIDEAAGIYCGWTALAGSFSDTTPVRNESEDVTLIFSGEEFSDPAVLRNLLAKGHKFDQKGPAYLAHLYEEDPSFLTRLNGRFHGLLVDQHRRHAVLFNDRFGMHRLYYHEGKDAFYFAAEAKAILAVRPELRELDPRGFGEFVGCGAVLEDRTLFRGIQVLPPGSSWNLREGRLENKDSYFHAKQWEDQGELPLEEYCRELRTVFAENLPRYFAGQQSIAMSLTGGLDTRMILATQHPEPGSLPCYTFGSMYRENQDVRVSRRVAEVCGQTHQVITAGVDFLQKFARYAERAIYLSDALVDLSRSPDLYLNEQARQIGLIRMTGNYGGEILRKVRAFKPQPLADVFSRSIIPQVETAAQTYAGVSTGHPVTFAAFRQAPWYQYAVLALEQTQVTMRSPFLDNDLVRTVYRSPLQELDRNDISLRLIAAGSPPLLRIPTDRGLSATGSRTLARVRRGYLEFLFKAEYASDMGMPQWLARIDHSIAPIRLEHMFLGRHKPFHFRVWYREALAGYLREMLLDPRSLSRPYLNRETVEAAVEGHVKGVRNYTTELHKLLTLELLHRLFVDSASNGGSQGQGSATCPSQLATA